MTTELLDGYFIYQRKTDGFVLKRRYPGKRKGVPAECEKVISHHTSFEDAAERFLSLFQSENADGEYKSVLEYINALKKANSEAVEAIHESRMEHFFMYVPKGTGVKEKPSIVDLIPVGRENAISRELLIQKCVDAGLVGANLTPKSKDRAMRELVKEARQHPNGYTIINLSCGMGYYQLTSQHKASLLEIHDLQKYIKQEEKRAKSTFKNISMAKRLYEDYKHGRIIENEGE